MSKFEIFVDKTGKFRWRLIANNKEVVATGEAYAARAGAVKTAKRLAQIAAEAEIMPTIDESKLKERSKKSGNKGGRPKVKASSVAE